MIRMLFVKRCATTKTPKFNSTLFDSKTFIEFEDIPDNLILNWDQTTALTMARQGSKHVEIYSIDSKRQIAAVLYISKCGYFVCTTPDHLQIKDKNTFLK